MASDPHPQDFTGPAPMRGLRFVDALSRGSRVVWMHRPRGGYGYTIHIPATVVSIRRTTGRVVIDAEAADGGTKRVTVRAASLRHGGG